MECFSCKTLLCCPEHCCDWDNCSCKDCENCGGEGLNRPPEPEPMPQAIIANPPKPEESYELKKGQSITDFIQMKVEERLKEQRAQEAKDQEIFEDKRKAERARHDEILSASRATIAKNKQVLESTQGTLDKLQDTIKGIRETERKFKEFQDTFGQIMSTAIEKCFGKGEDPQEMIDKYGKPRESSIDEAAEILYKANNVVIIVGAGVSAESGVFTYKDNEETWEIEGSTMKLKDVMDMNVLQSSPLDFWQAIQYNRMRIAHCSPNSIHYFLSDLMYWFRGIGKKVSIVTQNFDGFDKMVIGQDPDLYEIEGNINEMRCLFECCEAIFPAPELNDMLYNIPLCPVCSAICRPNVLLDGEESGEKFYRCESASNAFKDADLLVVLGTQLGKEFAAEKVREFAKDGKVIIEANIEPVVGYGNAFVLPYRCAEVAAGLVERRSLYF